MAQPITVVDAFTDRPFAGNQAAVCVLDAPTSEAWIDASSVTGSTACRPRSASHRTPCSSTPGVVIPTAGRRSHNGMSSDDATYVKQATAARPSQYAGVAARITEITVSARSVRLPRDAVAKTVGQRFERLLKLFVKGHRFGRAAGVGAGVRLGCFALCGAARREVKPAEVTNPAD